MRWDNLFEDLESQLASEQLAKDVDLQAEEERLRLARLGVRDRLASLAHHRPEGAHGPVRMFLTDGTRIAVTPQTLGGDWFAGELNEESGRRRGCVVPFAAIASILLRPDHTEHSLDAAPPARSAELGLAFVLRDLCRRRQALDLLTPQRRIHGTIDRVCGDHLDIAMHEPGRPRREAEVSEIRMVRLDQLVLVRL